MQQFRTRPRRRFAGFPGIALLLLLVLGACGGDKKPSPTAVPTVLTEVTAVATATVNPGQPTPTAGAIAELTDANSSIVSDGVCQARVPDGWVDDSTGRGSTPSGAKFVIFGNALTSPASWQQAVNAIATPQAGRSVASIDQTDDSIHVVYANDRGFEFRKRFEATYCDITVTSSARAIPAGEQTYWDAVISSLGPVEN